MCSLLGLLTTALLIHQWKGRLNGGQYLVVLTCWMVFLLFSLRLALTQRHWKGRGERSRHLLLVQLFSHRRLLLSSLICVALLVYINWPGSYVLTNLSFLKFLLTLSLSMLLVSQVLSGLLLMDKVHAMAQKGSSLTCIPLPAPYCAIEEDLDAVRQELLQAAQQQSLAIQKQMEHERLKAELVTNVSHDLKTPLTSVINYVRLLKKELPSEGPHRPHLETLEAKSLQLQSLTEDLLELSRLSAGGEKAQLEVRDFAEVVRQANGEFGEMLEAHGLELRSQLPNEAVPVPMDGGKLWRVMQNLYGNVAKYALAGTRVYASLTTEGGSAHFFLRNVSREELNLSPQELMERFVRGDASRHSQGNGLGLSIAQTLMELQGGTFRVDIQGDLFTAHLTLPLAQEAREEKSVDNASLPPIDLGTPLS